MKPSPSFKTLGKYKKSFNHTDPFKNNYLRQSEMISTMVENDNRSSFQSKCVDIEEKKSRGTRQNSNQTFVSPHVKLYFYETCLNDTLSQPSIYSTLHAERLVKERL